MKFAMRHLILAAAATLVAGLATTADAATNHRTGVRHAQHATVAATKHRTGLRHAPQATVAAPVDAIASPIASGNPGPAEHCFYTNYNPNTSLGQGSGGSLTLGRLVCN